MSLCEGKGRDSLKAHNLPEMSLSQHDSQYVTLRLQSIFNISWWRGSIAPASSFSSSGAGRRRQEEARICRRRELQQHSSNGFFWGLYFALLHSKVQPLAKSWNFIFTKCMKPDILTDLWDFRAKGEQVYLEEQQPTCSHILFLVLGCHRYPPALTSWNQNRRTSLGGRK